MQDFIEVYSRFFITSIYSRASAIFVTLLRVYACTTWFVFCYMFTFTSFLVVCVLSSSFSN